MTWEESSGEEWKRGTPYESREERALREVVDMAEAVARAFSKMAEASTEFANACLKVWAVVRLVKLGFPEPEAREWVESLVLVARAEGRPVPEVVRAEVERVEKTLAEAGE